MVKGFIYSIWETVEIALIAAIIVFLIRTFLVQPFLVSGASMEPNFSSGDYLLIDELTYRFREPERGEIVVFHYPGNESTYYIKRVIGLPGEKISFRNGRVYISGGEEGTGFELDEKYLPPAVFSVGQDVVLGEGEYLTLGDNRNFSFDSRNWGPLKKDKIVGLVRLRLWPIGKVLAVEKPSYQQ